MDLNDVDLQFLDAYNANIPFELSPNLQHDSDDMAGQYPDAPGTSQRVAKCTDAFRQAYWRFRPNSHDHGAAEEHNLSLPAAFADPEAPETMIPLRSRVTRARLGAAARDNILTFVVQSCRRDNVSKAVAAFPSLELLDTLVQYYLSSPVAQADSFLHAATFDPNDKRPELVAAMAAGGAVLTADPALTKLGYAIQECVRVAVPKLVGSPPSPPPNCCVGVVADSPGDISGKVITLLSGTWNCRKLSSSRWRWVSGADTVERWKSPRAFCRSCSQCSGGMENSGGPATPTSAFQRPTKAMD